MNALNTVFRFVAFFMIITLAACGSGEEGDSYTDRMAEEHEGDSPVQNESVLYEQQQPVDTMTVDYAKTDSGMVSGFLAQPENAAGDLPGLIVIHEWWGLNNNIRMMTQRLAGLGFNALAVDLYDGRVAQSSENAQQYMQIAQSDPEGAMANLEQAYSYLTEEQGADQVGVIGWCFGGAWSLQTTLGMPDKIDATVIYYGRLVDDMDQLRKISSPLIGFFGGQDQGIPPEQVRAFEENLNTLEKDAEIYIYEDAGHAFANPSGERYNKEAAQDAWEQTKSFLIENLQEQ